MEFLTEGKTSLGYEAWLEGTSQLLLRQDATIRDIDQWLSLSYSLLDENIVYQSNSITWRVSGPSFQFHMDEAMRVIFEDVTVACYSGRDFIQEISRARTFGFLKDIEILRDNGLAKGGSLDNAIVIDEFRILNEDGLRYKNEFVRHKILDFLGDLALMGGPVIGRFVIEKSGHFLNQAMLRELAAHEWHWTRVRFGSSEEIKHNSLKIPVFDPLEPLPV